MFQRIWREKRKKRWKSARKWRSAAAKKERLLKQLGRLERQLEPDHVHRQDGILIHVHEFRGRYSTVEFGFEFYRKDRRGNEQLYGLNDLKPLARSIVDSYKTYAGKEVRKSRRSGS